MKILVVCQYYYPENFQITPICEELAVMGHDVTVLTGLPNYPSGIVPREYRHGHRDEILNGVHVVRCYEAGRKNGVLHLVCNYLSFLQSSMWKVRKLDDDFDLVFLYQLSPILMGYPARRYAKKHGVPLFLYCCDLWPASAKAYFKNENGIAYQITKKISRNIYASAQRIAAQSQSFIPYLARTHGLPENIFTYLPAFANENYLTQDFFSNDEAVDFVFLGNLGMAQDLVSVLRAVELIRDIPNFLVHFVGDGSCLEEIKQFVQEHGLEKIVRFYGRRRVEEMPEFYRLADVCLVSLEAGNPVGLTLPSKVQGYMAAGKPVLGMIDGSTREVIEESQCGVCVPAGDFQALAAAMQDMLEHPEKYRDCGENGRRYFKEHFRKSIFMDKLLLELEQLIGEKNVVL